MGTTGRKRTLPLVLSFLALFAGAVAAQRRPVGRTPTPVKARSIAVRPTPAPTARPTPVPPRRVPESRHKGGPPPDRSVRFPSPHVAYSRILRVEEVDLDRDGAPELLVDGIGTVRRLPEGAPTLGFVSRFRLPYESPVLTVFRREGAVWSALFIGHTPLRCGQAGDLTRCDLLKAFRSERFRFDDRPQVLVQALYTGERNLDETRTFRLVKGKLETTFSASLPRDAVTVEAGPLGITRRIAVDTFINAELPPRYRSFTLQTSYIFGDRKFRVHSENVEEEWSERGDLELVYWGLVHQRPFADDLARLRETHRKRVAEGGRFDPAETVKKLFPDATGVRIGSKQPGLALVYFRRPSCSARAILYQPLREWEGEKTFWELARIRGSGPTPYECLDEAPTELRP